jgi:RNase P/RNase MRP subunit POP5
VYAVVFGKEKTNKLSKMLLKFFLSFFGEMGMSDLYFHVVKISNEYIIFSVKREHIKKALGALALFHYNDSRFIAIAVSGSLKKLKNKINKIMSLKTNENGIF